MLETMQVGGSRPFSGEPAGRCTQTFALTIVMMQDHSSNSDLCNSSSRFYLDGD